MSQIRLRGGAPRNGHLGGVQESKRTRCVQRIQVDWPLARQLAAGAAGLVLLLALNGLDLGVLGAGASQLHHLGSRIAVCRSLPEASWRD